MRTGAPTQCLHRPLEHIIMKAYLILIIAFLSTLSYSQVDSSIYASVCDEEEMGWTLEILPEVEGGLEAFRNWIAENNKLMNSSDTLVWEQFVAVQFWVDTTGTLKDIGVIRGIGAPYDYEAFRLVSNCPLKWTPGSIRGKKISVRYVIPVRFTDYEE